MHSSAGHRAIDTSNRGGAYVPEEGVSTNSQALLATAEQLRTAAALPTNTTRHAG
jgi:hypothetical protein